MTVEKDMSERRFRELFENIPDGVYETSPEGSILAANPALVRMLGFSTEEELRRGGAAGLYLDLEQRRQSILILAETGRLANAELRLRRKDGTELVVIENARAVRSETGDVLYYQGTLTDITDRKAAERALRRARDQALEAARLKTQFLANMSHELRTPLNAVLGMSELLLAQPASASVQECAETIHLSARILMDHISGILDYSRIEAGKVELESIPFDLREMIHQSASILSARAADKGLLLLAWAEPDVPGEVWGDPARLQQVLVNLLANAVKFTESGDVELHVSRVDCDAGRSRLRFEVRDTGIGIAASAQEAIFEPFQQADGSMTRRYGGTGLGLAIVRELLSKMGSRIELQSQPGAGSTFSFVVETEGVPATGGPALTGTVLLLEPHAATRHAVREWLKSWGLQVMVAKDAARLIALAEAGLGERWTAILSEEALSGSDPAFLQALQDWAGQGAMEVVLIAGPAASRETVQRRGIVRLRRPLREADLRKALETHAARAAGSLTTLAAAVGRAGPRRRLLVAEDNKVNQTVILRMIEKLGYSADLVSNGREAVDAWRMKCHDLVLMDCQMPELDGFLATTAIRESEAQSNRRTPIIALTAHATAGDRQACLTSGMDDYLSKPLTLDELARKLETWLSRPPEEDDRSAREAVAGVLE